jgi:hypothetical protein
MQTASSARTDRGDCNHRLRRRRGRQSFGARQIGPPSAIEAREPRLRLGAIERARLLFAKRGSFWGEDLRMVPFHARQSPLQDAQKLELDKIYVFKEDPGNYGS